MKYLMLYLYGIPIGFIGFLVGSYIVNKKGLTLGDSIGSMFGGLLWPLAIPTMICEGLGQLGRWVNNNQDKVLVKKYTKLEKFDKQ